MAKVVFLRLLALATFKLSSVLRSFSSGVVVEAFGWASSGALGVAKVAGLKFSTLATLGPSRP